MNVYFAYSSSDFRHTPIYTNKKYERFLINSKAVGKAHNTDKSRPYVQWTFADLLFGVTH